MLFAFLGRLLVRLHDGWHLPCLACLEGLDERDNVCRLHINLHLTESRPFRAQTQRRRGAT
jgi:hypothetical protein